MATRGWWLPNPCVPRGCRTTLLQRSLPWHFIPRIQWATAQSPFMDAYAKYLSRRVSDTCISLHSTICTFKYLIGLDICFCRRLTATGCECGYLTLTKVATCPEKILASWVVQLSGPVTCGQFFSLTNDILWQGDSKGKIHTSFWRSKPFSSILLLKTDASVLQRIQTFIFLWAVQLNHLKYLCEYFHFS